MQKRRRRLHPDQRRDEIAEAAERLIRREGARVRVEDVVEEAGAAKGTFYTCFETWDDLLLELRSRAFARFAADEPPADADSMTSLETLADRFLAFVGELGHLHTALFHSDFAQSHPLAPEAAPASRIAVLIRSGQASGQFRSGPAEATGHLLFAAIHEAADLIAAGHDREEARLALHQLLRGTLLPGGADAR